MFPAVAVPDFISKIHNKFLSNEINSFSPACSTQTEAYTCINGEASACSDLPAPKKTQTKPQQQKYRFKLAINWQVWLSQQLLLLLPCHTF